MKSNLISYAMDFASFLIQKSKFKEEIKAIILFGSAARGEASPDSDVDLFIDIAHERKDIEEDAKKCLADFTVSSKYKNYWKMLDVHNEIRLSIGDFKKWRDLHPSILANGITLYGKFTFNIKEGEHRAIFVWENIKPNAKRVLFNKQLFGYKQNNRFYNGLIQKYEGERLGKGCIGAPLAHANLFHQFFKKNKINVKIKKFLEY